MCHVAAWLIDRISNPPHGPVFKKWAARAMQAFPHLSINTCHSYDINFKHNYLCQTEWCGQVFGRHSKSIDVDRKRCGRCNGILKLMPKMRTDGTPAKQRAPSGFAAFMKVHFGRVKAEHPGASHAEVMRCVSADYAAAKEMGALQLDL